VAINYFHKPEDEDRSRRRERAEGLDEYNPYLCAYCGEENEVYVDGSATWLFEPTGSQRQLLTEECSSCCRRNLVTLHVGRDGDLTIEVEQAQDA